MSAVAGRRVLIAEDGHAGFIVPAARALGRAGWVVGLGSNRGERSWAAGSRWVRHVHEVPSPERGLERFTAAVNRAIGDAGYDVVLPGEDPEALALSLVADEIHAAVPLAPHAAVRRAIDKLELTEAARPAGLAVPATALATDEAVAAASLPVIVKPRLHWTPGSDAMKRALPVSRCATRDEAKHRVAEVRAAGGEAILQEALEGELMAISTVVDTNGEALAWSQQRTLRQTLRLTSARAVTVPLDEELAARALRLLSDLGWIGLANLQFLRPRTGEPRLIDLNGRLYGSIALALAAGADLVVRWASVGLGERPAGTARARPGVRFQTLEEDLARARAERRGGLLCDVAGCVRFAPRAVHSSWAWDDPLPALRELASLTRGVGRAARRRGGRDG